MSKKVQVPKKKKIGASSRVACKFGDGRRVGSHPVAEK